MGARLSRRDLLLIAAALPLGAVGAWLFDRPGHEAQVSSPADVNGAPPAGGPPASGRASNGAPPGDVVYPHTAAGAQAKGAPPGAAPPNGAPMGGVTSLGGPHYRAGVPRRTHLSAGVAGQPLRVEVELARADGRPAPGVVIDVWHAAPDGGYDDLSSAYRCRGQVVTDAEGRCSFTTVMPGAYMAPVAGGPLNPHLHLMARADGYRPFGIQWELPAQPDGQTHCQLPISSFQLLGGNPWTLTMRAALQPA